MKNSKSNDFLEFDEVKHSFKKNKNDSYKYNYKSKNSTNSSSTINPFKSTSKRNSKKRQKVSRVNYSQALLSTGVFFNSPKRLKIVTIIFLILLLYFLYQPLLNLFYQYLFQYPTFAAIFSDISREWLNRTLKGLFIMGFLGTIFIISFPSEFIFFQYIETSTNIIILIITLTLANTLAMILNYGFGKTLGTSILRFVFKNNFEKYQNLTLNYGTLILIFGNVFIGPIEVLAVMFGASNYDFKKYAYIVFISRILKYLSLIIIYIYFPHIIDYIII